MKRLMITALALIISFSGFSQKFDLGEINGADYFICIPENWNRGLVLYAHGHIPIGTETVDYKEEVGEFEEIFTSSGFAFAASEYRKQGIVIREGIEDTEALRSYFEKTYGTPDLCLITGHSMGGIIALATIEMFPEVYDGALPLCGWLAPVHSLLKTAMDMLVTFDYLFAGNSLSLIEGEAVSPDTIQGLLNRKPEMAELFAEHFRIRVEDLPYIISYMHAANKETIGWIGGLPVGNAQTIYCGFGQKDSSLNREVRRYHADQAAREYYIENYTPTGKISDPVLALHTTYDPIFPASNYDSYDRATTINGTGDLYVQQYVLRDGHCFFSLEETGEALDQLLKWIRDGIRPEPTYQ